MEKEQENVSLSCIQTYFLHPERKLRRKHQKLRIHPWVTMYSSMLRKTKGTEQTPNIECVL